MNFTNGRHPLLRIWATMNSYNDSLSHGSNQDKYAAIKREFLEIPFKVMVYEYSLRYTYQYYWTAIHVLDDEWLQSISVAAPLAAYAAIAEIPKCNGPYKIIMFRETSETLDSLHQSYYICFESEQDAFEYALRMK